MKVRQDDWQDCWHWTGTQMNAGYGTFGKGSRNEGKVLAHRWSFEYYVAEIPDGYVVHHTCENKACVRPDHLEAISRKQHAAEHPPTENHWGAVERAMTHCKRGHEFTAENTRDNGMGGRKCRTCDLERQRERRR